MSNHGIILLPRLFAQQTTRDESGELVNGGILPSRSSTVSAPYLTGFPPDKHNAKGRTYVPALFDLCLAIIRQNAALLESLPDVLPPQQAARAIRATVRVTKDLQHVHPLTWLAWVKTCTSELDEELLTYPHLALSDGNILPLARAPATPSFCLLVSLDLYGSRNLDDHNILQLHVLENLCTLDTGRTSLTQAGVQALAQSLRVDQEGELRGPWSLRVWKMSGCRHVRGEVLEWLKKFPLLCGLDLTGTAVKNFSAGNGWHTCTEDEAHIFGKRSIQHLYKLSEKNLTGAPAIVVIDREQYTHGHSVSRRRRFFNGDDLPVSPAEPMKLPAEPSKDTYNSETSAALCANSSPSPEDTIATAELAAFHNTRAALNFYRPISTLPEAKPTAPLTWSAEPYHQPPKPKPIQLFCRSPPPYPALEKIIEEGKQARAAAAAKAQIRREQEVGVARKRHKVLPPAASLFSLYTQPASSSEPIKSVVLNQTSAPDRASLFAKRAVSTDTTTSTRLGSTAMNSSGGAGKSRSKLALFRPP